MPFFKIYHGMGGGFGGAQYDYTGEFEDREEAMEEARRLAIEDYESFEGCHGIMDMDDCRRALLIDAGVDEDGVQLDVLRLQRGRQAPGFFDAASVVAQGHGAVANVSLGTGQGLLVTAGDDDTSAFMGVCLGGCQADAAAAASDENGVVVEAMHDGS